jgi:hypothetical protein
MEKDWYEASNEGAVVYLLLSIIYYYRLMLDGEI